MRYVLLCRDENPEPSDLSSIANAPGVKILEHSVPRALLVEASEEAAARLRTNLKRWTIAKEVTYSSPHLPFKKSPPEK